MALLAIPIAVGAVLLVLALLLWRERREEVSDELRDALGLAESQIVV